MVWNYRIATKIFSYKKSFENKESSEKFLEFPDERLFSIVEVYYQSSEDADNDKPDSYVERNPLNGLASKKEIKWTLKKIKKALKKDILDLDNWPSKWEEK